MLVINFLSFSAKKYLYKSSIPVLEAGKKSSFFIPSKKSNIDFRACLASLQKYIKVVYYSQKRKSDAK